MSSPLSRALGHRDEEDESRYTVNVAARVRELLGEEEIGEMDSLAYSWEGGYEMLIHRRHGGGAMEYRGAFHPGDGCCRDEDGNGSETVCMWCGSTLW